MDKPKQPDKQVVKDWINRTYDRKQPLQSLEQIRRELGWPLLTTVPNRRGN